MTCIVGIVHKGKVYIGGDSAAVGGYDVTLRKDPKVFQVGEFVMGCTSSFRMIQLIRFSFSPPELKESQDIYQYMCTDFINGLRDCFRNGGYLTTKEGVEEGGTFLVGFRGRLFEIQSDFQVGEPLHPFTAVGCGEAYALGVLHTMIDPITEHDIYPSLSSHIDPLEAITMALKIAGQRSTGVHAPFTILTTE